MATADLYPKITLTGGAGYESAKFADLFDSSSNIWNLAAGLTQPVFRGGELSARRRAAVAAYDEASAVYRETVLLAFQDVADVLESLERDAAALKAHGEAEEASRKSLEFTQRQFELGAINYLTLLNADRDYRQTRIDRIEARPRGIQTRRPFFRLSAERGGKETAYNEKTRFLAILGMVIIIGVIAGVKALQITKMIEQGKKFVPPPETVTTAAAKAESWETALTAVATLTAV